MEEDTKAAVAEVPPEAETTTLVALSPADMMLVQSELVAWCDRKIASVQSELSDLEANLAAAVEAGFTLRGNKEAIARTAKRVVYYEKLKAAIDAGYVIVPNFPVDVFAVRVKRTTPPCKKGSYASSVDTADPQLLPPGEGRYVDEKTFTSSEEYDDTNHEGKIVTRTRYWSSGYDDAIDFPVAIVKPSVLKATKRAMALKLFDQIGVVQNNSGKDPIVVGQILDPSDRYRRRCVTFFVAWWLDLGTL